MVDDTRDVFYSAGAMKHRAAARTRESPRADKLFHSIARPDPGLMEFSGEEHGIRAALFLLSLPLPHR